MVCLAQERYEIQEKEGAAKSLYASQQGYSGRLFKMCREDTSSSAQWGETDV